MSSGAYGTGLPPADHVRYWLRAAAAQPASLPDEGYETLLGADGPLLAELAELADALRQQAVGDSLTYVVNRNLDTAAVGGAAPASRARLAALVTEARELGATEICMQGRLPLREAGSSESGGSRAESGGSRAKSEGSRAESGGSGYLELIQDVQAAAPGIHLHAFRPPELLDGAARSGMGIEAFLRSAREAGLGSVPGTAARILDDGVRAQMMGAVDQPVAEWAAVIEAAHRCGLPSTATMVFGHVETPAQQVAHLRFLAGIQDRTGGFSELIAMPFVPAASATTAPGLVGRNLPGPTRRQVRAVHAVARLLLHGRIGNIQAAWPKLGLEASVDVLRGGANDLGGLLLDGRLAPEAGAEAGCTLSLRDVAKVAQVLGRPVRQRTTAYGEVPAGG